MKRLFLMATALVTITSVTGCGAFKATDKILPTDYQTVYREVPATPEVRKRQQMFTVSEQNRVVSTIVGNDSTSTVVQQPVVQQQVIEQQQVVMRATPAPLPALTTEASFSQVATTSDAVNLSTLTPVRIRAIQRALQARGYRITRVDGILGPETGGAIASFQRDRGLPAEYLSLQTLTLLGV